MPSVDVRVRLRAVVHFDAWNPVDLGYRTLRVAGRVTFRCVGAGKSVF